MATSTGTKNVVERLNDVMRQHADVVVGHDAVHPDRNDCGGVGGCALMRAEHDIEVDVISILKTAARMGLVWSVNAEVEG